MRKPINRLDVLVEQELELNPFADGAPYLIGNRARQIMKALYWDATRVCLWQKRLVKHQFWWPEEREFRYPCAHLRGTLESLPGQRRRIPHFSERIRSSRPPDGALH